MPKTFIIKGESISNLLSQGSHIYIVVTARVEDFPTDIPLTPNVREPNKKSSTYKEILNSLVSEPKAFFNRNNGIKISAKKATQSSSGKDLHVEILQDSEGYTHFGVYDGGHTLTAINAAKNLGIDLKEARVKVEVTCGLNEEEVAICALAANTTSPVDVRSRINARGEYDHIKRFISKIESLENKKYKISYYQNQSGVPSDRRCSINHIYKMLICLDRVKYDYSSSGKLQHPTSLQIPKVLNATEEERINRLLPLLPQALEIERELYKLIEKYLTSPANKGNNDTLASISTSGNTILADGSAFGFRAPAVLSLPAIAAYRAFLDSDYNWIFPFEEFSPRLLKKLWSDKLLVALKKEKAKGNNAIATTLYRRIQFWSDLCTTSLEEKSRIFEEKTRSTKKSSSKLTLV
jgi:hypothetical protein